MLEELPPQPWAAVDPELVELVRDQLDMTPADRLRALLDDRWPACADALRAAVSLGEPALLVGPIAAAVVGAPHRLTGRVDVLIDGRDCHDVDDCLFDLGVEPTDVRMAGPSFPDDRRTIWGAGAGALSVRIARRDVEDGARLRRRVSRVAIAEIGIVRVPHPEDLLRLSVVSPWSEERVYVPSLRALLAIKSGPSAATT